MAHEKHVDLPDDFDTLLRRAMAVEPSAGFLPRVRERTTAQPRRLISWWPFAVVAGPAAAAALVLLVWTRPGPVMPSAPEVPPGSRVAVTQASDPVAPVIEAGPKPRVGGRLAPAPNARGAERTLSARPEERPLVVIDRRQRAALATLMRLVREGTLTHEAFAQSTAQPAKAISEQVFPVSVAPVEVSPIPIGGVLHMGTERN